MPSIFPSSVAARLLRVVLKLVVAGLFLSACAACTLQKKVPAAEFEAERQQRHALQASQQNLIKEIEKQTAIQAELEDKLAAENLMRRRLQTKERLLEKKLKAESAAQAELLEQIAAQDQQHHQRLEQQAAEREAVAELKRQLARENLKREEWEQWQEQLVRDQARHPAASEILVEGVANPGKQLAEGELQSEEWESLVEGQDLKQQSPAREALKYGDANLYLLLLEKKAYIARLTEQIEKVISEVVRAKAKLRSLESKAEAASNLAEVEIEVESLRARGDTWKGDPNVIKAEQLTRQSALEFEEGNYGGALYLTSKAKNLIETARARSMGQEKSPVVDGEVPFLLPLTLQLLTESDVRKGPGSESDVMYFWESGTALVGHAFKGQWVRVTNNKGLGGWVFYKSVGSI